MFAHGFQVINLLVTMVLVAIGIVVFLFFSYRRPKILAVTFGMVCVGLCIFLLYLILVPQK
jgi:membrane protein YdbS with pleckstrin-like domain